jgi:hypothetical protein
VVEKMAGAKWKCDFEEEDEDDRGVFSRKALQFESRPGERASSKKTGVKRPLSAFMFFSQAKREAVKAANPDATFGGVGKLVGEAWRTASEEVKAEFQAKAKAEAEAEEEEEGGEAETEEAQEAAPAKKKAKKA